MERIEINVQTGERQVIPLTPREIADGRARDAVEKAERAARGPNVDIQKLHAWAISMGYRP